MSAKTAEFELLNRFTCHGNVDIHVLEAQMNLYRSPDLNEPILNSVMNCLLMMAILDEGWVTGYNLER